MPDADKLTLEKLQVAERLRTLEKEVARLGEIVKLREDHCITSMTAVNHLFEKYDKELNGNGGIGLRMQVDRVQQILESRTKHVYVIYATLVSVILGWVFQWFQHVQNHIAPVLRR